MLIPIKLIRGYNAVRNEQGQWVRGQCLLVVLDDGRFLRIPLFALAQEYFPGERDIFLEIRDCSWSREWSEEEWRREMKGHHHV